MTTPQFAADLADVLNSRELDRFDGMFAPDFTNHNELAPTGTAGFKQFWTAMIGGLPDLGVTLEDVLASGDEVSARDTLRVTHRGAFMGLPATGRPVELKTMEFWRFENGLVVEHWDSVNTFEVLQQLGVLPSTRELFTAPA